jgi:hypothetical protein
MDSETMDDLEHNGYNSKIEEIRDKEYPMLKGKVQSSL